MPPFFLTRHDWLRIYAVAIPNCLLASDRINYALCLLNMTAIQITRLDTEDIAPAVEIFFAAFDDDPLMSYFFEDRYQSIARQTMQYICDRANVLDLPLLGAVMEGELQGVALMTPPEAIEQETAQLDEQFAIAVGEGVISRLETYSQVKKARQPQQPHFYLDILGVLPESQGQGIGKTLLTAIHQMSEASSLSRGVALDTGKASNVDLYQHFGYSVTAIDDLEQTKLWSMFRANSV